MDGLQLSAGQQQRMSVLPTPVIITVLQLLPLSTADLDAWVSAAVGENPVLERRSGTTCATCGRFLTAAICPTCRHWQLRPDADVDRPDWREDLKRAAHTEVNTADRAAVDLVVDSLDDHGLLPPSERGCTAQFERIVRVLREVGPPGVAASSPLDCVARQVHRLVGDRQAPAILGVIVEQHLELAGSGQYSVLAELLDSTVDEVRRAVKILRNRVRPFVVLTSADSRQPPPDLVIRRRSDADEGDQVSGELIAETADAAWYGLRLDAGLLDGATGAAAEWLAPYRRHAAQLLQQIDMRARTLRRIGEVLIERQRPFLFGDAAQHRSLRRADVASDLQMHPSTISRAVQHKWLRCPDGRTIALAACFGSRTGPEEQLRGLLARYPHANDAELAARLTAAGIPLARRTVAKYRAALGCTARPAKRASRQPG